MTRDDIVQELLGYIEEVARPLAERDMQNGWSSIYQNKAITMMTNIVELLRSGKPPPSASIVRTMDSWGVEGRLFDKACAISHHLHTMND